MSFCAAGVEQGESSNGRDNYGNILEKSSKQGVRKEKMLHYQLEGDGLPLLLIHGWGVTYPIWQNLIPLLRSHFQLIMIELPGTGGSPDVGPREPYYQACAEAIEEVRLALGIERWAVLAYSSGTRAAEAYLQQYPEHVIRVALLCPVYLKGICSLGVRFLVTTHNSRAFTSWLFSDWRLYSLVVALGFNGHRHDYTRLWKDEIELQPLNTLVRSLCELPGRGRAPFQLPTVPALFIWGSRDALAACPAHPRPNDIIIPANHSAPMLAAPSVAEAVIPFLTTGTLPSLPRKKKRNSHKVSRFSLRSRDSAKKIETLY
jgi:pimeloyl-ACP methyl ester carboxylesterase